VLRRGGCASHLRFPAPKADILTLKGALFAKFESHIGVVPQDTLIALQLAASARFLEMSINRELLLREQPQACCPRCAQIFQNARPAVIAGIIRSFAGLNRLELGDFA